MTKARTGLVALALLSGVLAGCSGEDTREGSADPTPAETRPTPEAVDEDGVPLRAFDAAVTPAGGSLDEGTIRLTLTNIGRKKDSYRINLGPTPGQVAPASLDLRPGESAPLELTLRRPPEGAPERPVALRVWSMGTGAEITSYDVG